ncbi:MAG: YigZ family protein [Ignavibacteria bacterium]
MIDSYFTIKEPSASEIKINKSKFIPQAFPLRSQLEIPDLIKSVQKKFYDASHHPNAFRVGLNKNNFRSSDDGEPSGSSGKPVLEAIDKYKLTDTLVIVTRYFGGIKLGVGGLRRAYFDAAELCLKEAEIIEKLVTENLELEFDYKYMNVIMNLIEAENLKLLQNTSDEKCKLTLEVRLSKIEKLKNDLTALTNGSISIY